MAAFFEERVLDVKHWTDTLFSFTTTRDAGFRFLNGQFVMIGLPIDGKPLLRAYSVASANYEETLEFYSIKVANGALTSRLKEIVPGDTVIVGRKPTGTLVQDSLKPGRNLYLLATGTGLAPFVSVIKDPEAYERFERIVLVHGCRSVAELAYGEKHVAELATHEYLGEVASEQLLYYPTVTREPFRNRGRVTDLLASGKIAEEFGLPALDPAEDRAMICGSPEMLADTQALLESRGFDEGSHTTPGAYVIEKAFVER
ncbi:ferredoxin--NADP reductase [Aurantimonas sp. MSK8Z-1]|uniref:ferredoxin--NADP reductase n=1 Tax=Mangrovibrevibacter kandeliae TaxID=2968473 RepID=UPI0021192EE7|nr:ferredoxin--NADP reductase [Aurantimonas sp. MSK8Z-1]MCW4113343.1 ferredoxin--NADP reductase [Aurantimonas sp. MSK8Z-1]